MPDPIDELESFTMPGTTTPLPPSEVRRRGDHLRRRNNVLAAAGGLAVIAAVAAPITAVALSHDTGRPEPMPAPAVTWRQGIPDTVDLGAVPGGSTLSFVVRPDARVADLRLCGETAFSTSARDGSDATDTAAATAVEPGTDGGSSRTLVVFPDAATASGRMAALRDSVLACGSDRRDGVQFTYAPVPAARVAAANGFVYVEQVRQSDGLLTDLTAVEVARVGNALLLTTAHTSAGGQQAIDGTVPNLVRLSAPVVEQMCVFAAEPCR